MNGRANLHNTSWCQWQIQFRAKQNDQPNIHSSLSCSANFAPTTTESLLFLSNSTCIIILWIVGGKEHTTNLFSRHVVYGFSRDSNNVPRRSFFFFSLWPATSTYRSRLDDDEIREDAMRWLEWGWEFHVLGSCASVNPQFLRLQLISCY